MSNLIIAEGYAYEIIENVREGFQQEAFSARYSDILTKYDPETGKPMVDVILDRAGNKGTGKWTSQSALDLGVPLPLITESVFARFISALKTERVAASQILPTVDEVPSVDKAEFLESIRQALFFSKIMSYAQGFSQI